MTLLYVAIALVAFTVVVLVVELVRAPLGFECERCGFVRGDHGDERAHHARHEEERIASLAALREGATRRSAETREAMGEVRR